MASIILKDLEITQNDSFIEDLTEDELNIVGGKFPWAEFIAAAIAVYEFIVKV